MTPVAAPGSVPGYLGGGGGIFMMVFMEVGTAMGGDIGGGGGGTGKDLAGSLPETCLWPPWYMTCGKKRCGRAPPPLCKRERESSPL